MATTRPLISIKKKPKHDLRTKDNGIATNDTPLARTLSDKNTIEDSELSNHFSVLENKNKAEKMKLKTWSMMILKLNLKRKMPKVTGQDSEEEMGASEGTNIVGNDKLDEKENTEKSNTFMFQLSKEAKGRAEAAKAADARQ